MICKGFKQTTDSEGAEEMILGSPYYKRCFVYSRSEQNFTQIY